MSPFARIVVIGVFSCSVYGLVAGWRDYLPERRKSKGNFLLNLSALACWVVFFLVRNLFGWKAFLLLLVVVVITLGVSVFVFHFFARRINPTWSEKLNAAISQLDIDEDSVSEWAVTFFFALIIGGWFYFLLFAPFGVLCALGIRACG